MSDIALLTHLAPVLGEAPSGLTVRGPWTWPGRQPCWTGSPAPARERAHVWMLIEEAAGGFPWLVIAGKAILA